MRKRLLSLLLALTLLPGMLVRAEGTEPDFSDLEEGAWYTPYVLRMAAQGVVNGFEDGSFRPGENISREQLAVMLQRYLRAYGIVPEMTAREAFADESRVSDWALEAVNMMRDAGLMNGRGENLFEPKGTATRAEICAVVYRIAELAG